MVTSWQAVRSAATMRPMEETRKSWLNLLNFMCFLRHGPTVRAPGKTCLGCPAIIVKARYGVLPPVLLPLRNDRRLSLLYSRTCAVVRNGRQGDRLGIGRVGRILRYQQRSGARAQLKAGDGITKEIGGVKEMVCRGIDAHGYR